MDNIILIDTSGSMMEDGKESVIMYVLNTIKNTLTVEPTVYTWDKEIKPFSGKIEFGISNDSSSISSFFDEHNDEPIILITDGCFSSNIKSIIKKHSLKIVCILVGIDSSIVSMQRTVGVNRTFEASDTVACISRYLSLKEE